MARRGGSWPQLAHLSASGCSRQAGRQKRGQDGPALDEPSRRPLDDPSVAISGLPIGADPQAHRSQGHGHVPVHVHVHVHAHMHAHVYAPVLTNICYAIVSGHGCSVSPLIAIFVRCCIVAFQSHLRAKELWKDATSAAQQARLPAAAPSCVV